MGHPVRHNKSDIMKNIIGLQGTVFIANKKKWNTESQLHEQLEQVDTNINMQDMIVKME